MSKREFGLATRLIHGGAGAESGAQSSGLSPRLDRSTTFRLSDEAELSLAERDRTERFDMYGRMGTETTREVARLVAEVEGGQSACLFSSGMAAIASTFLALTQPGDLIALSHDVYGTTESFVFGELVARGVEILRFDASEPSSLRAVLAERRAQGETRPLRLVWAETISNPLLKVCDTPGLAAVCEAEGADFCLDATFSAGMATRPLSRGAHVVVHSATKYINGHSDVIAGAVVGDEARVSRIHANMTRIGGCIDPMGAWLLARGVRTLSLRYVRQCETAAALAARLAEHPAVARVYHPLREDHPTYAVARKELSMGGGVLSFELADATKVVPFTRALKLCAFAVSLGGVETLVAVPRRSSHVGRTPEDWEAVGIRDSLIRLAVGLEDLEDVWADLDAALESTR